MKFLGCVPLVATAYVEIEAEDENEAMKTLMRMYDNGEVNLDGYDSECLGSWWVERQD